MPTVKKGKKIEISMEVIRSTRRARVLINAPKDQLLGKTFILGDFIKVRGVKAVTDLTNADSDTNGRQKVEYSNVEKSAHKFGISVSQLMYMDHVPQATPEEFDKLAAKDKPVKVAQGEASGITLYDEYLERAATEEAAGNTPKLKTLPEQFTVVSCEDLEKDSKKVYPPYMYKAFSDKFSAAMKISDEHERGEAILDIYRDNDLMDSLLGEEGLLPAHKNNPEPVKALFVHFSIS